MTFSLPTIENECFICTWGYSPICCIQFESIWRNRGFKNDRSLLQLGFVQQLKCCYWLTENWGVFPFQKIEGSGTVIRRRNCCSRNRSKSWSRYSLDPSWSVCQRGTSKARILWNVTYLVTARLLHVEHAVSSVSGSTQLECACTVLPWYYHSVGKLDFRGRVPATQKCRDLKALLEIERYIYDTSYFYSFKW